MELMESQPSRCANVPAAAIDMLAERVADAEVIEMRLNPLDGTRRSHGARGVREVLFGA